MPSLNKAFLVGHAGGDMEERTTTNGKRVIAFTLATSNGKDRPASWHSVEVWNAPEWLSVSKGDLVYVEGRIAYDSWTGKDGQKKYKTKIVGFATNLSQKKSTQTKDDIPF